MHGLDKQTFENFRRLVYDKSGITLGPQKEALVSARIGKRMRGLNIQTYSEYYDFVLQDESGRELIEMIDAISTNVTSFYREPDHFELLADLLKKWSAAGQRRFRIWCAAASTGEEPYSIAITVAESVDLRTTDVKILATDISTRVLEKCLQATYTQERVQSVPPALRDRYFERLASRDGTVFRVREPLRKLLIFRRLNLATPPFSMKGPLDVVMCRNVMIYFDNLVRGRLLTEVHRLLKPGGYLMVGHAESLTGLSTPFKTVRPSVYQK
jgi:chemotaxis protein methyltransferase CheR